MTDSTFARVCALVARGEVIVSAHGYDELAADDIIFGELLVGIARGRVVEDNPLFPKGPCVLILQRDGNDDPVHVLWGIPKGRDTPAVLVTAYRPDAGRWSSDFLTRRAR